jgi:hypothetical protein
MILRMMVEYQYNHPSRHLAHPAMIGGVLGRTSLSLAIEVATSPESWISSAQPRDLGRSLDNCTHILGSALFLGSTDNRLRPEYHSARDDD